jgi:UDP-glucose 4-epimerase
MSTRPSNVFVTGGAGYLGGEVVRRLNHAPSIGRVVVLDVREPPGDQQSPGVDYRVGDVRDPKMAQWLRELEVDVVVHLASIVNPGGPSRREFERSVDVGGTENVLQACVAAGVGRLIVTSSGAAYGYHADNPVPLRESDALRGNVEFPYADHKRLVEELLLRYRKEHPELKQLVLRPGTVLGERTDNQITKLFKGRFILGLAGFDSPFVFIWDQDVAEIIVEGILREKEGIYNLAGDGALAPREIARILGKPYLPIPPALFMAALWGLQKLGLTVHGPQQVKFLQYRPVLSNEKLKSEFGYRPRKTSREAFEFYLQHSGADHG